MRVDVIQCVIREIGMLEGHLDGALDAFAVFRRMRDVVSVRTEAVADDFGKDVGAAFLRMFF